MVQTQTQAICKHILKQIFHNPGSQATTAAQAMLKSVQVNAHACTQGNMQLHQSMSHTPTDNCIHPVTVRAIFQGRRAQSV